MKIELFIEKLSHDHSVLLDDGLAATGWIHGMEKPTRGTMTTPIEKLMNGPASGELLPHLGLRKEKWGAFLVHGPTASVYQLDTCAAALFERLKNGESMDDLEKRPDPCTSKEFVEFRKLVDDFGLLGKTI